MRPDREGRRRPPAPSHPARLLVDGHNGGVSEILRSPRWLVGHVIAVTAVIAFVALGSWQLQRLEERRTGNALITARSDQDPAPLADVLARAGGDPEALAYLPVTVTGTYLSRDEIRLSTRPYQGRPGHHLLTPLLHDDGRAIVVDRGWVPIELDDPPVVQAAPGPPGAEVTVTGFLVQGQEPSPFGVDVPDGETAYLGVPDLARIQQQVDPELAPVYLQLSAQEPAAPQALPFPAEPPALDEGSHLSYAGQWFLFAAVVAVGYPILLRRTTRARRPRPGTGPAPAPRPDRQPWDAGTGRAADSGTRGTTGRLSRRR